MADPAQHEWPEASAVLRRGDASTTRLAGDRYVFVEFGDDVLDFCTRAKVAELQAWLEGPSAPPGVGECSPGVRSALIEYDACTLPLAELLRVLERCAPTFWGFHVFPHAPLSAPRPHLRTRPAVGWMVQRSRVQ